MPFEMFLDIFGGDVAAAAAGRVVAAAAALEAPFPAPPLPPEEPKAAATTTTAAPGAAAAASLPAAPVAPRPTLPPSHRAAAAAAFAASPSNPPPRRRVAIAEEPKKEKEGGENMASPFSPPRGGRAGGENAAAAASALFEPKREPAAGEIFFSRNGSPLARFDCGGVLRTAAKGGGMGKGGEARAFANPLHTSSYNNNGATTFTILKPAGAGGAGGTSSRAGLAPGIEFNLASGKRVVVDVENSVFDDAGLTSKEAREVEEYLTGLSRLANVALRSRKGAGRAGGGGSRR